MSFYPPSRLDRYVFGAFVLMSVFFAFSGSFDLWVSRLFYNGSEFYLSDWLPFVFLYDVFAWISKPLFLGLLIAVCWGYYRARHTSDVEYKNRMLTLGRSAVFLLLLFIVGGIVVEIILKLGWGRARPRDIVGLGGDLQFTSAWFFSDQCSQNCSFMSGHASMGFYFMGVAWLTRRLKHIGAGVILGLLLGLTRVAQGGHFASDVLLPGFVVFFIAQIIGWKLYKFRF